MYLGGCSGIFWIFILANSNKARESKRDPFIWINLHLLLIHYAETKMAAKEKQERERKGKAESAYYSCSSSMYWGDRQISSQYFPYFRWLKPYIRL